jgi:hypothetical protein
MAHPPSFLLLSCSQRKNPAAGLLPALDRYAGPQYQVVRKWLRTHPALAAQLDIAILSARFGLLMPMDPIPTYDQRMTPARAAELRPQVTDGLKQLLDCKPYQRVCISLGSAYAGAHGSPETFIPAGCQLTYTQGSQGRRLAMLRDWLYQGQPPPAPSPALLHGQVRLRGVTIALPSDRVQVRVRQIMMNGHPPSVQPQSWYVEVDGRRVGPKWLVSQLTGLPVASFGAGEARRVLTQLGIEVHRL